MEKPVTRKILFIVFILIISLGLGLSYLYIPTLSGRQKTYFDLKTYPKAQTVDELQFLENQATTKASLHTKDSLPQVAKWYIENSKNSGWVLDLAPENPNDNQIQLIRFAKENLRLTVSLISDGSGGTNIIFEQIQRPGVDKKNYDQP